MKINIKINLEKILIILLSFITLIKTMESFYLFSHGDALYYQMVVAKELLTNNLHDVYTNLCGALQSGVFELLFYIPMKLFGATVKGQLASQFIHFFTGQLFAAFLIFHYFKEKSFVAAAVGAISVLTISKGTDFFLYAKSDGTVASLSLLTFLLIYDRNFFKKLNNDYVIAILLGLIPSIKMSGLLNTAVLALFYIYKVRDLKKIIVVAIISLFVLSPILIRNYYYRENPFYPGLLRLFPGNLSESPMEYYLNLMNKEFNVSSLFELIKEFFVFKILFVFILIRRILIRNISLVPVYVSLASLTLYTLVNGGVVASRFFFFCFFLNIFFIGEVISKERKLVLICLFIVLSLVDSKIDKSIKRVKTVFSYGEMTEKELTRKLIKRTRIWDYIPENSKIIGTKSSQTYYAPTGVKMNFRQCNNIFEFFRRCSTKDYEKLEEYDFAFLGPENLKCANKIKNEFPKIFEIDGIEVYKLIK